MKFCKLREVEFERSIRLNVIEVLIRFIKIDSLIELVKYFSFIFFLGLGDILNFYLFDM